MPPNSAATVPTHLTMLAARVLRHSARLAGPRRAASGWSRLPPLFVPWSHFEQRRDGELARKRDFADVFGRLDGEAERGAGEAFRTWVRDARETERKAYWATWSSSSARRARVAAATGEGATAAGAEGDGGARAVARLLDEADALLAAEEAAGGVAAFASMGAWSASDKAHAAQVLRASFVRGVIASVSRDLRGEKLGAAFGGAAKPRACVEALAAASEGDSEARLRALCALYDGDGDGYLARDELEAAWHAAFDALAPSLTRGYEFGFGPGGASALARGARRDEARAIAKHGATYFRDIVELATKVRCVFAWAEKAKTRETTRPNGRKDLVEWCSADEALAAQAEFFGSELGELAQRTVTTYVNVREQEWNRRKERRITVSLMVLFLASLHFWDDLIISL